MIFVFIVAGLTLQWYILVKIPITQRFLESWIKKDYIISYLGKYTGSRALVKLAVTLKPVVGVAGAEIVTKSQDAALAQHQADCHLSFSVEAYKNNDLAMDKKKLDSILKEA